MPFAGDDDDLPLASLFLGEPAIDAIGLPICRLDVAAKISTVHLDGAGQFFANMDHRTHRLAQLVEQHEGRLRIDVHVALHLQRRRAFHAVAEQRDHAEVVTDRQLAAMEDRAGRDAELAAAGGALPANRRLGERVDVGATTMRAERATAVIGEADLLEHGERFLIGQPKNLSDGQAPCGWGNEEVLCHPHNMRERLRIVNMR
jgi:hypothetical protein